MKASSRYLLAGLVLAAWLGITACAITVPSKPAAAVKSAQPSFDGNVQNSGILTVEADGIRVTAHFLERYDALLAAFGSRLSPPVAAGDRRGITPTENGEFVFTAEALTRFDRMNQWRKAARAHE